MRIPDAVVTVMLCDAYSNFMVDPIQSIDRTQRTQLASLVLAGGESKRMGFPKLTLRYQGETLLGQAIKKAQAVTQDVTVVVGAYEKLYTPIATELGANVVMNPHWSEGLASSLRVGVAALSETTEAALVVLPDQPFVPEAHLRDLVRVWRQTHASLVFSRYEGILGAPCVLARSCFIDVQTLTGDKGARALVSVDTTVAEVPLATFVDVDTPEEVRAFLKETP
jgi:molybdenum cofactor cytidylyltransferase